MLSKHTKSCTAPAVTVLFTHIRLSLNYVLEKISFDLRIKFFKMPLALTSFSTFILNDMSSIKYQDGTMHVNAQEMC
jgi:hypothetical protein